MIKYKKNGMSGGRGGAVFWRETCGMVTI